MIRRFDSARHRPSRSSRRQRGAALIVALILLVVVSLLALSNLQTVALEEKMTGATYDRQLAFQAAEKMLKEKEGDVDTATFPVSGGCSNGLCKGECGVCNGSYCALTMTNAVPCYRDPSFTYWSSPTFDQEKGLCSRTLIEEIDATVDGAPVTRYRVTAAVYRPASGDADGCNPAQRQGLVILQSLVE
jgi:type IV pilus assembly protein PilX